MLILFVHLGTGAMNTKAYLRYDLLFSHLAVCIILIKEHLLCVLHRVLSNDLMLVMLCNSFYIGLMQGVLTVLFHFIG
jgi:hypothetical protein